MGLCVRVNVRIYGVLDLLVNMQPPAPCDWRSQCVGVVVRGLGVWGWGCARLCVCVCVCVCVGGWVWVGVGVCMCVCVYV